MIEATGNAIAAMPRATTAIAETATANATSEGMGGIRAAKVITAATAIGVAAGTGRIAITMAGPAAMSATGANA